MHGIIYSNLYRFVRENHGAEILEKIKNDAKVSTNFYDTNKSYPDSEILNLLNSACNTLKIDIENLLEIFGNYIAPKLLVAFKSFIDPEWGCLDLLERTETFAHKAVRMTMKESTPPILKIKRVNKDQVLIEYTSERKLISLGIGIIKTFGDKYNEKLQIEKKDSPNGVKLIVTRIN
jgi:hypothetical protein